LELGVRGRVLVWRFSGCNWEGNFEKKEGEKMVCMDSWVGRDTGRPRENKRGPGVRVWPESHKKNAEFVEVTMGG
jgi:hypothetical protein